MILDSNILQAVLAAAPAGVLICESRDDDWACVFANEAMEQLTGYTAADLLGRNPAFLAGEERDQDGLRRIRDALENGEACTTVIRNFRADGSQFFNEIQLIPLRSPEGQLTHYASFHKESGAAPAAEPRADKADPMLSTQTMMAYLRDDKLTGLLRRPYFEEMVKRDWGLAQRESRPLSFMIFDLDFFLQYRDVFGRQGADQTFRRIARVVCGGFRRASDLCGRFDEDQIAALTTGLELSQAAKLAETVLGRVRDLAIHHPRSGVSRYVTASAGVVSILPKSGVDFGAMFEATLKALTQAKVQGRNQIVTLEMN